MGTPQMGHQSKMAFDTGSAADATVGFQASDFDSDSTQFEYISESLVQTQTRFHSDGIRGTRSKREERCRVTQEAIGGTITFHPTPDELAVLLPLITGSGGAAGELRETLSSFGVLIDRGTNRFAYDGCVVNSATFSASAGQPMSLTLNILGKKENVGGSFSTDIPDISEDAPWIMSDAAFSLPSDASATELMSFSVEINNELMDGRYMNSITRTDIPSGGRSVNVSMSVPYTADEAALYDAALFSNPGATITLTQPSSSDGVGGNSEVLTFTFGGIEFPGNSPTVAGKNGEYMLSLAGPAYATDTRDEVLIAIS